MTSGLCLRQRQRLLREPETIEVWRWLVRTMVVIMSADARADGRCEGNVNGMEWEKGARGAVTCYMRAVTIEIVGERKGQSCELCLSRDSVWIRHGLDSGRHDDVTNSLDCV